MTTMMETEKAVFPTDGDYVEKHVRGAKRANICQGTMDNWWVGHGKDESCQFEGTWWDMICFARNVLAAENTKKLAPEYHKPEWQNDNY
jgi:hypothetical protein